MIVGKQALGSWGEELALRYLLRKGDILIARNFRTKYGELDLVMRRGDRTVFVEVKTRRSDRFGTPQESITYRKQEHLAASATAYLKQHPELDGDWQIDVIAIRVYRDRPPLLEHIDNAVSG